MLVELDLADSGAHSGGEFLVGGVGFAVQLVQFVLQKLLPGGELDRIAPDGSVADIECPVRGDGPVVFVGLRLELFGLRVAAAYISFGAPDGRRDPRGLSSVGFDVSAGLAHVVVEGLPGLAFPMAEHEFLDRFQVVTEVLHGVSPLGGNRKRLVEHVGVPVQQNVIEG
ncbi:hypothetical protein [Mycobacterium kyorinense]|uniref:hypothetical protein n=1 Tax=Mycobacterium kyorinense TaxID=487514 RepID=UPI0013627416|nr:hypothetical protein [Mycobacterium kyorinense]